MKGSVARTYHRWVSLQDKISAFRRRLYLRIPRWVRQRDFELFTSFLCCLAGLPLLTTDEVTPGSLESTLPPGVLTGWAAVLAFAPLCIVVGLWKAHGVTMLETTFWWRLEAFGLRALAYAAYLYSVVLWISAGGRGFVASILILVFALTCHSRSTATAIRVEDFIRGLEEVPDGR